MSAFRGRWHTWDTWQAVPEDLRIKAQPHLLLETLTPPQIELFSQRIDETVRRAVNQTWMQERVRFAVANIRADFPALERQLVYRVVSLGFNISQKHVEAVDLQERAS